MRGRRIFSNPVTIIYMMCGICQKVSQKLDYKAKGKMWAALPIDPVHYKPLI